MLTGIGTMLLAVIASFGGFFAWKSLREAARATARSSYSDYAAVAVQHPEFNIPDLAQLSRSGLLHQYEWFVFLMLQACEEIVVSLIKEGDWERTIELNTLAHREYLTSKRFRSLTSRYFKVKLLERIESVLKLAPVRVEMQPQTIARLTFDDLAAAS